MEGAEDLAISAELQKRGLHLSRGLGQNFMIDRNMLDFIVRAAGVTGGDVVFEVGTGAGFLTQRLCQAARHVVSVEIDRGLHELAAERLAAFANLTLLHADALSGSDWNGEVKAAVLAALEKSPGAALKLVANLPYSIATAVIQKVLEGDPPFAGVYFTCQKEVADRITARPGASDYGFISVLAALVGQVRVVRKLPPSVFWPRPKIESALVEIIPSAQMRAGLVDIPALETLVSRIFTLRRKTLHAAMRETGYGHDAVARAEDALEAAGFSRDERVFRLSPEAIKAVAAIIRQE